MRPYSEPVSAELREKLIVNAAAGMNRIYHYFEAQRLLGTESLEQHDYLSSHRRRLDATNRVHADRARNSSIAAARPHCIKPSFLIIASGWWSFYLEHIERFYARNLRPQKRWRRTCRVLGLIPKHVGERKTHAHSHQTAAIVALRPMRWRAAAQADQGRRPRT